MKSFLTISFHTSYRSNCKFFTTILKSWDLYQIIIMKVASGSIRNIKENISAQKRIDFKSLKTIENYKNCKAIQFFDSFFRLFFCLVFFFFRLFFSYCNSHVCLAALFLEIIPKTMWICIIAFLNQLIRKHITHGMDTNTMAIRPEY